MSELKKCPFCGGEAKIELFNDGFFDYARIFCCYVRLDICDDKTGEKAIAAWNRRAQPENEPIVRCGECEKYQSSNCAAKHEQALMDFCSHAVRKEEGGEKSEANT